MESKKVGFIILLVFFIIVILANLALVPIVGARYKDCKSNQYTLSYQGTTLQSTNQPNQVVMGSPNSSTDQWILNCSVISGEEYVYLNQGKNIMTISFNNNQNTLFLVPTTDQTSGALFKLIPTGIKDQYTLEIQGMAVISQGSGQNVLVSGTGTPTPFTLTPQISAF